MVSSRTLEVKVSNDQEEAQSERVEFTDFTDFDNVKALRNYLCWKC